MSPGKLATINIVASMKGTLHWRVFKYCHCALNMFLVYFADEEALVKAAREMKVVFESSQNRTMKINVVIIVNFVFISV